MSGWDFLKIGYLYCAFISAIRFPHHLKTTIIIKNTLYKFLRFCRKSQNKMSQKCLPLGYLITPHREYWIRRTKVSMLGNYSTALFQVSIVVFDKTGTVTLGKPIVNKFIQVFTYFYHNCRCKKKYRVVAKRRPFLRPDGNQAILELYWLRR